MNDENKGEKTGMTKYDKAVSRIKDHVIILGIAIMTIYGISLHGLIVEKYETRISELQQQKKGLDEHISMLKDMSYPKALETIKSQTKICNIELNKLSNELQISNEKIVSLSRRPTVDEYNDLVVKYHKLKDQFIPFIDKEINRLDEEKNKLNLSVKYLEAISGIFIKEKSELPPEELKCCMAHIFSKYGITKINTLENYIEIETRNQIYKEIIDCYELKNFEKK